MNCSISSISFPNQFVKLLLRPVLLILVYLPVEERVVEKGVRKAGLLCKSANDGTQR